MKPIGPSERKIANIHDGSAYSNYPSTGPDTAGTSFIQLNPDAHAMSGSTSTAWNPDRDRSRIVMVARKNS